MHLASYDHHKFSNGQGGHLLKFHLHDASTLIILLTIDRIICLYNRPEPPTIFKYSEYKGKSLEPIEVNSSRFR